MESEKEIRLVFLEINPSRKYLPQWAFLKIMVSPSGRRFEDGEACFWNRFYYQACYHASQSAEKALKSIIIDLGELPPKTHALNRLKGMLSQLGSNTSDLEDLKLNFLTRMHTSTRYPSEDHPPVQLFDQSDGEECLEIAEKVINFTRTMKKDDA